MTSEKLARLARTFGELHESGHPCNPKGRPRKYATPEEAKAAKAEQNRRWNRAHREEINRRARERNAAFRTERACEHCGVLFTPEHSKSQRYCCKECSNSAWYERNREKLKARSRAHYRANRDRILAEQSSRASSARTCFARS